MHTIGPIYYGPPTINSRWPTVDCAVCVQNSDSFHSHPSRPPTPPATTAMPDIEYKYPPPCNVCLHNNAWGRSRSRYSRTVMICCASTVSCRSCASTRACARGLPYRSHPASMSARALSYLQMPPKTKYYPKEIVQIVKHDGYIYDCYPGMSL